MKNIYKKIKFDKTLYFFLILILITGMFKQFTFIFLLIFFHELGHALTGIFFKWELSSITFYPYGGITKFNNQENSSINQEIIILLMGPITQIIVYLILSKIYSYNYIKTYHLSILIFNLLPILTLDGGRLLNLIFNKYLSYLKSFYLSLWLSFITIFFLIFFCIFNYYNLNLLLMDIFLLFKIILLFKDLKYSYKRFLLERYLYDYKFSKTKLIKNINSFYKECYHFIYFKDEKSYLNDYFKNNNINN